MIQYVNKRLREKYGNNVELISASSLIEINARIAAKTQEYLQEKEAPVTQTLVSFKTVKIGDRYISLICKKESIQVLFHSKESFDKFAERLCGIYEKAQSAGGRGKEIFDRSFQIMEKTSEPERG